MSLKDQVKPLPPHAKKVFQGNLFSVWQWEQELYNGKVGTFERVARSDYAGVVGVLDDKQLLLVRDEQPDRGPVLTPAGGGVEAYETPAQGVRRELQEETGYEVSDLRPWFSYRPNGRIDMTVHMFIARGLKLTADPVMEGGERIEPQFFSFDDFIELGHNPILRDLMLRIVLLEAKLDPAKRAELEALFYAQ